MAFPGESTETEYSGGIKSPHPLGEQWEVEEVKKRIVFLYIELWQEIWDLSAHVHFVVSTLILPFHTLFYYFLLNF